MNERLLHRNALALRRSLLSLTLLAAGLSIARDAAAASRLEYVRTPSAAECPEEGAFRQEVAQRLGYDPFFPSADRMVSVELDVVNARAKARIVVVDEHGFERGSQALDGSDCAELVRAASLAVSIALEDAPKPAVIETKPSTEQTVEETAPPVVSTPAITPAITTNVRAESPRVTPSRTPLRLTLAPQLWGGFGQFPLATFGVGAAVSIRRGAFEIAAEGRWDAPATLTVSPGEDVQIESATGSIVPCLDVGIASFCAVATFGATWANGETVANPESASAFYAAFGARAGLSIPLTRALRLGFVAQAEGIATPMHVIVGSQRYDSGPVAASIGTNLAMSIF